jgi:hypothetical protein
MAERYSLRSRLKPYLHAARNQTFNVEIQDQNKESGKPPLATVLQSPLASSNAFRAAREHEFEGILLFKEEPRQIMFLFIVVVSVAHYSFTHDSDVRIRTLLCVVEERKSRNLSVSIINYTHATVEFHPKRAQRWSRGLFYLPRVLFFTDT